MRDGDLKSRVFKKSAILRENWGRSGKILGIKLFVLLFFLILFSLYSCLICMPQSGRLHAIYEGDYTS